MSERGDQGSVMEEPELENITPGLALARRWEAERRGAQSPAQQELMGIGTRLDALVQEREAREAREAVQRAEELLAQQRARAKLELDFAGWYSHGEAPVWTLGYYEGGAFRTVPWLAKSTLTAHWFPLLHRQGITPYVTRQWVQGWVPVLPNAY